MQYISSVGTDTILRPVTVNELAVNYKGRLMLDEKAAYKTLDAGEYGMAVAYEKERHLLAFLACLHTTYRLYKEKYGYMDDPDAILEETEKRFYKDLCMAGCGSQEMKDARMSAGKRYLEILREQDGRAGDDAEDTVTLNPGNAVREKPYGAALKIKYGEDGLSRTEITDLYDMLGGALAYPVGFEMNYPKERACIYGFLTKEAAGILDGRALEAVRKAVPGIKEGTGLSLDYKGTAVWLSK